MARRNKKQDRLFKRIAWIIATIAVLFLAFQLRDVPSGSISQSTDSSNPVKIDLEDDYEAFTLESLDITFQFPRSQSPLKADTTVTDALALLRSRNFNLAFYNGPGFVYQPWPENDETVCRYDGALSNFSSSTSSSCVFEESIHMDILILVNRFVHEEKTKHVTVLPIYNRRYFMVISADYVNDCSNQIEVCEARSAHLRDKLIAFTNDILEKNHNLFTQ